MLFDDSYKSIKAPTEGFFKDRGSKFYGYAFPVYNDDDIKQRLDEIKQKWPDATHHCYAYYLNPDKSATRFNDDGEPSNTAGRPIQRQLQSLDLTNVLVIVVRYYGGKMLGVPGLINAYGTTAKDALDKAEIVEKHIEDIYSIEYDYQHEHEVFMLLNKFDTEIVNQVKEMKGTVEFAIKKSQTEQLINASKDLFNFELKYVRTR